MIAQNFEYSSPNTLQEALQLLADGTAKVLAGGMSLIPMMKLRLAAPEHLVDLRRLADLKTISESAGDIHIGAMATHYDLESSPLLRQRCPLLAEAAGHIGTCRCETWALSEEVFRMPIHRPTIQPLSSRSVPKCAWYAPEASEH